MLATSLELKTTDLLRNGSLFSAKRSTTDQAPAEPAATTRLPLSLSLWQSLTLTSPAPQGRRTPPSSTDALSKPQVAHGTILQSLSQVLTGVSASVTASSSATGQVISTRVSAVAAAAAAVTGLVITPEGLVITQEDLVIIQDRVITLIDQVITTLDRVITHGQVTSQGLLMMIMLLVTLQALSCTRQALQQTRTGIGCRGTLLSIV